MASLPARVLASFQANIPNTSLDDLDGEFNQLVGAAGFLKGGTTGVKLLIKASDASDPPVEIDQVGAGPLAEWKQNGTLKTSIANSGQIVSAVATGTAPLSVASTTVVTNLNADKLDGKHAAEWTTLWSASFFIADVAARGVDSNADNVQRALIPGANFTATHIFMVATSGVNSGGFTLQFIKSPFDGSAGTLLGQLSYDPGGAGHTLNVGVEGAITPHTFTANDFVQVNISGVSAPQEKAVIVGLRGYQTLV